MKLINSKVKTAAMMVLAMGMGFGVTASASALAPKHPICEYILKLCEGGSEEHCELYRDHCIWRNVHSYYSEEVAIRTTGHQH